MRRLLLLVPLLLLLMPALRAGASPSSLIRDCEEDSVITGSYSQGDYSKALRNLPTDVDEYTDCRDVIRRAQLAAAAAKRTGGGSGSGGSGGSGGGSAQSGASSGGGGTGSGGSGGSGGGSGGGAGSAPPTAQEKAAVDRAAAGAGGPVKVGDVAITPGAGGVTAQGGVSKLPTPLLVALAAVLALGLAAGGVVLARRLGLTGEPGAGDTPGGGRFSGRNVFRRRS